MKDLGTVQSTVKPEAVDVRDSVVFVADDIKEITVDSPETGDARQEYQYSLKQYTTEEYIHILQDRNTSLEQQATDAQVALCDLYEIIGG